MATKRTQQKPSSAYGRAREDIANLCKVLEETMNQRLLDDCTKAHWGHVGTVQHIREQLIETILPLAMDADLSEENARKKIEARLDAMRE